VINTVPVDLQERCTELVEKLGLAAVDQVSSVRPLTGGVASDIAVVDIGEREVCVKFALEKLRVAEDWRAPVERNAAEYAWLDFAGRVVSGSAPELFGRDADLNGFVMEFVQPDQSYLWKAALLKKQAKRGEAGKVGKALGAIHSASAATDFDTSKFQNQGDFYDLRLEPYLGFTATVHVELADTLRHLIDVQESSSIALIHGDVSPKNILFRNGEPVFLDAECATMGDPGFDVAFCLNHLALKAFHMPESSADLIDEFMSLWASYSPLVSWENVGQLEARVCELLPALMLARIDGKSPVEYLDEDIRAAVREFARVHVMTAPVSLDNFARSVTAAINE
jgi:aminoglycoside phosphotransferase (APT) family kinase protein